MYTVPYISIPVGAACLEGGGQPWEQALERGCDFFSSWQALHGKPEPWRAEQHLEWVSARRL